MTEPLTEAEKAETKAFVEKYLASKDAERPLALPLSLEGCHLRDANGVSVALLGGEMAEYRASGHLIVTTVNNHAELTSRLAGLLAAAKAAVAAVDTLRSAAGLNFDLAQLRAAIAAAEEQAL